MRLGWKADNVVHCEDERLLDQTMKHQAMLIRIDRRNPGMMALKMQAVRGNDPCKSCHGVIDDAAVCVDVGARGRRMTSFSNGEGLTVGRAEKRRALFLHPCRHMWWPIVVGGGGRRRGKSG